MSTVTNKAKDKKTTKKEATKKQKEIVKNIEKANKIEKETNKKKKRLYFGFNTRFFVLLVSFVMCSIISFQLIIMSFSVISERTVDYQERSNIDYRVYLKENEFYDENYLGKDMVYVSSLIKNIEADFRYDFNINEESDINFDYSITGKLSITDANETKTFFEKDYTLLENKKLTISDEKKININETIKINYGYYNDIANRYRQQFGVNSQSYFVVSLVVNKQSVDEALDLNNSSVISLRIPLTQNEVNIKMDSNEINNNSNVISKAMFKIDNLLYIGLGIISIIISIIIFIRIIKYMFVLIPKSSNYDKILGKILKEYDRFIVETTTEPDEEHLKVIRVHKFIELLDVRDNLSQPIKYYNVTRHQKCIFYINYENEIYIYTLKAVDLEDK